MTKSLALVLVPALWVACSTPARPGDAKARAGHAALYDRIGGRDAIAEIVKDFVEARVTKDKRISARFASSNPLELEDQLTDQLCEAAGGPCKYTGKPMRDVHANMALGDADFAAFVEDFGAALAQRKVPAAEQKELLAILTGMRDEVVGK